MPRAEMHCELYENAFRAFVAERPDIRWFTEPGREFLYRPGQLLVAMRDVDRVARRLREIEQGFDRREGFGGVERLQLNREADIPGIVADLRDPRRWPSDQRVPAVQPHHITIGFGNIMGNPNGPPIVASQMATPPNDRTAGAAVTVGICDTGIWHEAATRHADWLGGSFPADPSDEDPLYAHDDVLDFQGGHGTFVAGVLRQAAPGVLLDPEPALEPSGIGDEQMLVQALADLDSTVDIVNLSLGYFTDGNVPPMPIANALAALRPGVVVVAAAGNAGQYRQAWPAAFSQVIGVAAVTRTAEGFVPASYTNYGPWVSACADGDRVSTYVDGRFELGTSTTTFTGYAQWQGTSFATPHVAGYLATQMTTLNITAAEARLQLLAQTPLQVNYGVLVP